MSTYAEKSQDTPKRSVADARTPKQSGGTSAVQFVDNRPASIAHKKLQEMADASPQVRQLSAIQAMADNSLQATQAPRLREQENGNTFPSQNVGGGYACIQRQVSKVTSRGKSYWESDFDELKGESYPSREAAEKDEAKVLIKRKKKEAKQRENKINAEKRRAKARKEHEEASRHQDPNQESMEITYVTGKGRNPVSSAKVNPKTAKAEGRRRYLAAMAGELKGNQEFFHFRPVKKKRAQHFKLQDGHDYVLFGLEPVVGGGFQQVGSSGAKFEDMAKNAEAAAESLDSSLSIEECRERVARDINRASRGSTLVGNYDEKFVFGPAGIAMFGQTIRADKARAPKAVKRVTKDLMGTAKRGFSKVFGKNGSYIGLPKGSDSGPARLRGAEVEGGDVSEGSDIEELEQAKKRAHGKMDEEQKQVLPSKKKRKKKASASSSTDGLLSVYTINGRHYDVNDPRIRAQGQCLWDTLNIVYGYSAEALQSAATALGLTYEGYVDDTDVWRLLSHLGATGMTLDVWQYGSEAEATRTVQGDGSIVLGLAYDPDGAGHYIPPWQ